MIATFQVITTWPNHFQLTTFTTHDDVVFGDVDGDGALDVLPPNTQALNYLNLSHPASPFLGWRITVDQLNMTWSAYPIGNESVGIILFFLFAIIPLSTAIFACWVFRKAFYSIKFNQVSIRSREASHTILIHSPSKFLLEVWVPRKKFLHSPFKITIRSKFTCLPNTKKRKGRVIEERSTGIASGVSLARESGS